METTTNEWLQRARDAYTASTTFFDSNIRSQVEADIKQASGRHPSGSKYYSDAYKGRSKLFRPKTAMAIRKNDATAAAAFFSTEDVISITPENDSDEFQLASARGMEALVQYRLTKSIPWFMICIGAHNDAQTVGVVASKQYWEYNEKKRIDRPVIDLIPVENIRIDPACKWYDPIGTSPYVINLIPMYIKDVMGRMKNVDPKTGQPKWKTLTKDQVRSASKQTMDSTRQTREGNRTDSTDNTNAVTDYTIVWVHENIVEMDGEDKIYYTLGTEHMLSDPKPIEEVYAHGRPFVIGVASIEPHKLYPSGLPRRSRDVQTEINQIANSRIDNVMFAMNKRYFVKRGQQVDLRSLQRNVPGSATLMIDPEKDVKVQDTPDVTASAYQEQDRLNLDFDDISGSFSQSSVQSNRNLNETVGGMEMLTSGSNQMSEFQLRVFSETWVEPVLRQLVHLEQQYETDEAILALAGQKLIEKYGIDYMDDNMIMQEFTINVNVGVGATNPQTQVERFVFGMRNLSEILGPSFAQRINVEEITVELFGKLGYKDGKRFFNWGDDPKFDQLIAQIEELTAKLEQKEDPNLTLAKIKKLEADVENVHASSVETIVKAVYASMQAGQVVATLPQVAPIADEILGGAGYQDQGGDDPNIPQPIGMAVPPPDVNMNTSPMNPPVAPSPMNGIETIQSDGTLPEMGVE